MMYVRAFHLVWVGSTSEKKRLVFTVLLRLFSAGIRREGEGKSSPERGRKRISDLDFAKYAGEKPSELLLCCAISGLCSDLAVRRRYPKADVWYSRVFFSRKQELLIREQDGFKFYTGSIHSSRAGFLTHREPGSFIGFGTMIWKLSRTFP